VGIGSTSPIYKLDVNGNARITNLGIGSAPLTTAGININPGVSAAAGIYLGVDAGVVLSTAGSNGIWGQRGQVYSTATGTQTGATYGIDGSINNAGSGTLNTATGIQAQIQNTSNGVIGTAVGVNISPATNSGGGSITNNYGLYIGNQTAGSTTNYAIFSNGGQSYFAGNIGIGTTTISDQLTVNGNANLTTGNAYKIAGTSVLNATTLGTGVVTSSLTTVGALNAGSITSGFGNINNGTSGITTNVFTSTQATGTAPLTVASTTKVTNLNADFLDGIDSTGFCQSDGTGCSLAQFWQRNLGTLSPTNITDDVLFGGTATTSAKFAFINNIGSGTPTASVSAGANGAAYFAANGTLATTAMQNLTLGNGTTGDVIINPSRNVGIGTTNATGKLTVVGSSGQLATLIGDAGYGTGFAGLSVQGTFASNSYSLLGDGTSLYVNRPAAGDIQFRLANSTQMTLTAGGNLGIGTTATTSKLQVNGGVAIGYATATTAPTNGLDVAGNTLITGNVGIGTSTVSDKLNINGNIRFTNATSNTIFYGTAGVAAPGAASAGQKIQLYGTAGTVGAGDYALGIESGNLWMNSGGGFKWYASSTEKMRMDANGNLGIGTTTTSPAKLSVSGNTYVSGNIGIGSTTPAAALDVVGQILEFSLGI
jgi:hypothetical protein